MEPPPPPSQNQQRPPPPQQQQGPPPYAIKGMGLLGIDNFQKVRSVTLPKLVGVIESILKEAKENEDESCDLQVTNFLLQISMRTQRPKLEEIIDAVTRIIEMTDTYLDIIRPVFSVFMLTAGSFVEAVGVLNFPLKEDICRSYIQSIIKFFTTQTNNEERVFIENCDALPPCSQIFCTRYPELFQLFRDHDAFINTLNEMRYRTGGTKMLHMLCEALQEEKYVVLDLENQKGFEVVQSGCTDNVQFSALLGNELVEKGGLTNWAKTTEMASKCLKGEIPPQTIPNEQITGNWDMYNWIGLTKEGNVEKKHNLWVWCEGTPSDVARFYKDNSSNNNDFKEEGVRVLVITKPMYQRYHGCTRVFSFLKAEVKISKVLEDQQFQEWINKIKDAEGWKREKARKFVSTRIVGDDVWSGTSGKK